MKKSLIILSIAVIIAVVSIATVVQANPSFFIRQNNNGTTYTADTTMLGYMSPLVGTTTIAFDSMANGNPYGVESAILALQFTGSTTPTNVSVATTTYNVNIEYSQDSVDWYSESKVSTTTTLGWETIGGVLIASTTPTKIFVDVPTPTRYTRAIITIPAGSTNGAVWAEFIARKEVK